MFLLSENLMVSEEFVLYVVSLLVSSLLVRHRRKKLKHNID
jgi:hypothetical protein